MANMDICWTPPRTVYPLGWGVSRRKRDLLCPSTIESDVKTGGGQPKVAGHQRETPPTLDELSNPDPASSTRLGDDILPRGESSLSASHSETVDPR